MRNRFLLTVGITAIITSISTYAFAKIQPQNFDELSEQLDPVYSIEKAQATKGIMEISQNVILQKPQVKQGNDRDRDYD